MLRSGGEPVQLSLDARMQYILREETAKAIADFNAIGGMGIVMDVNTGEVLAHGVAARFRSQRSRRRRREETIFNRATLGDYEMGSVFKIFTIAMALDDAYDDARRAATTRPTRSRSAASPSMTITRSGAG